MPEKHAVLIAISGGVDSSVAATILKKQFRRVEAVFMQLHHDENTTTDHGSPLPIDAASMVADQLGIKLHILDCRDEMRKIIQYFIDEYKRARTPNPCLLCNRDLKFSKLLDFADSLDIEYLATGHYARIRTFQHQKLLCRAAQIDKDQSYALFTIKPQSLNRVIFPLGDYTKTQVRQLAKENNLHTHSKAESQEICFVPNDDYVAFINRHAPELSQPGDVIDTKGQTLGRHQGIFRYTIGQRRGLGIALGQPAYVIKLDRDSNTVVLGSREELASKELVAENVNWFITPPTEPLQATVQIRYNNRGASATITTITTKQDNSAVRVDFHEPVSAVTPGQAAVFYNDNQAIIGGGWINNN